MISKDSVLTVARDLYQQMRAAIVSVQTQNLDHPLISQLNSGLVEDWETDIKLRLLWLMIADSCIQQEESDLLAFVLDSQKTRAEWEEFVARYAAMLKTICTKAPVWSKAVAGLDQVNKTEVLHSLLINLATLFKAVVLVDGLKQDSEIQRQGELLTPFLEIAEKHGLFVNRLELLNDDGSSDSMEQPEGSYFSVLSELDALIGLESVKREARSLIHLARLNQLRLKKILPALPLSMHLVFTGNPGTGKTTVARLISRVYSGIGLLSKGHLVEVDRSALVAGYVGQTALKVHEVVKQALGGILFLDEAYNLVQSPDDSFGKEALDTLLKLMEDYRRELVVIVAGYNEPMDNFLSSNPGLRSRFNRFLHFPDYSLEELLQILMLNFQRASFIMDEMTVQALREKVRFLYKHRQAQFGNGREMRNLFESIVQNQANRLMSGSKSPTSRQLMTIEPEDIL